MDEPPSKMPDSEKQEEKTEPLTHPRGRPYTNVVDGRSVSMLGLGMIVGAVIGAGIALLMAPESGSEVRHRISRRARRLRGGDSVWTKLGNELQRAAGAKRKSLETEAREKVIAARQSARREPPSV